MNSINMVSIQQPDMHFAGSLNRITDTTVVVYKDDPKEMYSTEMTYLLNFCTWYKYITMWHAVANAIQQSVSPSARDFWKMKSSTASVQQSDLLVLYTPGLNH